MSILQSIPYVVLIGDVGTGKSTVVEKLTGQTGRSRNSSLSFTRSSQAFYVSDRSMLICDTPGSNAIQEKTSHNVFIAAAMNKFPVSKILIIVKADGRIDNVIESVRKYAERLLDLSPDIIGALVTHMDIVNWTASECMTQIKREPGIDDVVFSSIHGQNDTLLRDIHRICLPEKQKLVVDPENFLKIFRINNNHVKILQCTNKIVADFKQLKSQFDQDRKAFDQKDQVDLIFEFQAWMSQQIVLAQKRMTDENNFTFFGDEGDNEAGHIANMTNQLRLILHSIRVEAAGFQSEHGVSEARRCPFCNLIWSKVEGCDGQTTCGNRPSTVIDVRDPSFGVLGTFTFKWIGKVLGITKIGTKKITGISKSTSSIGCGNTIQWSEMPRVELPYDLKAAQVVGTDDVQMLPESLPGASNWTTALADQLRAAEASIMNYCVIE